MELFVADTVLALVLLGCQAVGLLVTALVVSRMSTPKGAEYCVCNRLPIQTL